MADHKTISKLLSYWLRHKPDDAGLQLDPSGWADVDGILAALVARGLAVSVDDLHQVVAGSDKNRFELAEGGQQIRARQGHSVKVDLDWPITTPPEYLYHGTVERFLVSIMAEGLKPMARHHVHLSGDAETARIVGSRRGTAVILRIAAGRMAADGLEFRLSGNGVWLAERVPPAYLCRQ